MIIAFKMEGRSAICYLRQFPKGISLSKQILKNHLLPFGVFQIGEPIYTNDIIKVYVEFRTLENAVLAMNELRNTHTIIGEMTLVICSPRNGENYNRLEKMPMKQAFHQESNTENQKIVR